jgi:hypothetical protein
LAGASYLLFKPTANIAYHNKAVIYAARRDSAYINNIERQLRSPTAQL